MLDLFDIFIDVLYVADLLEMLLPDGFDQKRFKTDAAYRRTKCLQIILRLAIFALMVVAIGVLLWIGFR